MYVIGTAGHVDHGKSTLITSLTGINPDRLREEQERQMTIDLGFAWFSLPSGREVGIVDVPGHRDFIENMLAGVGGIDAVLFIFAADEGIMPQSREHLEILKLLDIKRGLIVLTKIDLVEDIEWIELVESDIRALVSNSFLEKAPIARISAVTGEGLKELAKSLDQILFNTEQRKDIKQPRLPIDRIFSLKGFGTIVTGTLLEGSFKVGDQVQILPSGIESRIRSLQNHKRKKEIAEPGTRTAINLVGVDVNQIKRGDTVCVLGQYEPTSMIDVSVELIRNAAAQLKHDDRIKVFTGTSQTIARIRIIGEDWIRQGESGWCQLVLEENIVVKAKDRFIIRRPSPATTIGGGIVLSAHPSNRHKRFSKDVLKRFKTLTMDSPKDTLRMFLNDLAVTTATQLAKSSELDPQTVKANLKELINRGEVIAFLNDQPLNEQSLIISKIGWARLKDRVIKKVKEYHKKYPLRNGMPIDDIGKILKCTPKEFSKIVQKMCSDGVVVIKENALQIPGHSVIFSNEQEERVQELKELFAESPAHPPSVSKCVDVVGQEVYDTLVVRGTLVEISLTIVFQERILQKIKEKTKIYIQKKGKITVADFRDYFETSRKYAVALLEYLDEEGLTYRNGDYRTLKSS